MNTYDETPPELAEAERRRDHHTVTEAVFELRDTQAVGRPYRYLEGRAVPYGIFANIGPYLEQHAAGAFTRSTKGGAGQSAPLLLGHKRDGFPLGHAEGWTHDADGMTGVWRLNDTAQAQQAAELAERGDLVGLSVGFQPIRSSWEMADDWNLDLGPEHLDRCTRHECRLLEVSMTPTPAFAEAVVAEVREAVGAIYARARAELVPERLVDQWRAEHARLQSGSNA